ncbi:Lysine-specific demethylase 4B [Frankliniella fusca]|uniref:Lysine-specific demethylase 4B n=1 Tax=Frankliniella fusca TaxID=407009 RepID=A0AAE1LLH2_9NEOP|nr:Lysine-specific demethylase 4B [Frankliniella fusca]
MESDECSVTLDQFGFPTINVTRKHLRKFPALISWIRQEGYVRDTGLVKLRLSAADRKDDECVKEITRLMTLEFKRMTYDDEADLWTPSYSPSVQITHKASPSDHIYQYSKANCTTKERKISLYKMIIVLFLYFDCSKNLQSGDLDQLRIHLFSELEKSSRLLQIDSEGSASEDMSQSSCVPVYGDGIVLKEAEIAICDGFTISSGLDKILCELNEKYDGLACPYYYAGDKGTLFGISPNYFGFMDKICSGLRVDLANSSCRAFLVDHKSLVADPEFFRKHFQVPYAQVMQEPGDFIITLPFGLHAGFNTGKNLAIASNFADLDWIEFGIYAPICSCNDLQIHLDLSGILEKVRPELLNSYHNGSALVFPRNHPREVRYPDYKHSSAEEDSVALLSSAQEDPVPLEEKKVHPRKKMKSEVCFTKRILHCPDCYQSFKDNKYGRPKSHIENHHPQDKEDLLRIAALKYPAWRPKMTKGLKCEICEKFIRGDKRNMKIHIAAMHHPDAEGSLSTVDKEDFC